MINLREENTSFPEVFTSYSINFTTYMKAIYKYNTIFYTEIVDKDNENMKGKGKRNEGYIKQTD